MTRAWGASAGAGREVACSSGAQRSAHLDRSPPAGLSNTAGALPGVLGVTAAGYLLDKTGSWAQALFFPTAACQLVGLVVYSIFASSKRQDWE